MSEKIKIEGLEKMKLALKESKLRMNAAAAAAVAREVAAIGDDAQAGAPVDTGELRESIRRSQRGMFGRVQATARHAGFVEFGTSKAPAQPYMMPAVEKARRRFVAGVALVIRKAVG